MSDKQLQTLESIQAITADIACSIGEYEFEFRVTERKGDPVLQIFFDAPCSTTGKLKEQACRKWPLQYTMAVSEVVRTAHKAARAAYEHECDEMFTYKGADIFSPHTNVEQLVAMHSQEGPVYDIRVEDAEFEAYSKNPNSVRNRLKRYMS